ncbi:hypothetical protein SAMN02799625_00971 [Methylobacterium sp. UNC300MFChir4.1]|uniref:hypothetical protein n=1 Tax=Methylobacterium sp. UNC300MFChir4.1 TaxID=1502747 RepID=UPI0008C1B2DC|nr:hypothetical protein [Methylobacterium sp. UNC300MFChir4.1]SEN21833.1 hypothetical protein SAMN02799625_00971 [Methylobacterium sp. UNC300MFChir4.1]
MTRILTSVLDSAVWVADALDDILVEAALGFGAAVPLIADPSGDPPTGATTGQSETSPSPIRT